MKKILSLSLSFLLLQSVFCLTLTPPGCYAQVRETLSNQEIVGMVKNGFSEEIIIAKIKSSKGSFDTSTSALQKLKKAGVTNAVISAMIRKPTGGESPIENITLGGLLSSVSQPVISSGGSSSRAPIAGKSLSRAAIPEGTEIKIKTIGEISGNTAVEGDPLIFNVAEDVKINGRTVIARDAIVKGTVSGAKKNGMLGKGGNLSVRIESAQTVDGQKIKLRAAKSGDGGDRTNSTIVLTVLLGPIGLLRRGKVAKIKEGTILTAYTDENKSVMPKQ